MIVNNKLGLVIVISLAIFSLLMGCQQSTGEISTQISGAENDLNLTEGAASGSNPGTSDQAGGTDTITSKPGEADPATGPSITVESGMGRKLSFLGQIGGNSYAVDVQGNIAYLGVGPRIYVLDVTDPSNPIQMGISNAMNGVVRNIIAQGNYAYVAAGKGYVHILDISNSAQPVEVSSYSEFSYAQGLALEENRLYVADNAFGLRILDVSNPLQPQKFGEISVPGSYSSVVVDGNQAYMAGSTLGTEFVAVDLTNPGQPAYLASISIPDAAGSLVGAVTVYSNYAFVAAGNQGLVVLDISNPTQPLVVGRVTTPWADGVVIDGTMLYLSDWVNGLYVVDITDPTNPSQTGFYEMKMSGQQLPGQRNMVASDGVVYIANINQGLTIIDGRQPGDPVLIGKFDAPVTGTAFDVVVESNNAYLINDLLGLFVVDVAQPAQPTQLGFDTSRIHNGLRTPCGVSSQGNHVYVVDVNNGFSSYDVSDPTNPIELSRLETPQGMTDVAIAGNYAYVSLQRHDSQENRGFLVFDISNPSQPVQINFTPVVHSGMAIAVQGNYLYYPEFIEMVETGQPASLRVFDVSNPVNPVQVSEFELTNVAPMVTAMEINENFAYLGDQRNGLRILDISDANHMVEVGSLPEIIMVMDLVVVTEKVFTASYATVDVLDVSDPTLPRLEEMYQTPGFSMGIYAIDNIVYVADFDGGLLLLKYVQ